MFCSFLFCRQSRTGDADPTGAVVDLNSDLDDMQANNKNNNKSSVGAATSANNNNNTDQSRAKKKSRHGARKRMFFQSKNTKRLQLSPAAKTVSNMLKDFDKFVSQNPFMLNPVPEAVTAAITPPVNKQPPVAVEEVKQPAPAAATDAAQASSSSTNGVPPAPPVPLPNAVPVKLGFKKGTGYGSGHSHGQTVFHKKDKDRDAKAAKLLTSLTTHVEKLLVTEPASMVLLLRDRPALLLMLLDYLRNDSTLDMETRQGVYVRVLAMCRLLASVPQTAAMLQIPAAHLWRLQINEDVDDMGDELDKRAKLQGAAAETVAKLLANMGRQVAFAAKMLKSAAASSAASSSSAAGAAAPAAVTAAPMGKGKGKGKKGKGWNKQNPPLGLPIDHLRPADEAASSSSTAVAAVPVNEPASIVEVIQQTAEVVANAVAALTPKAAQLTASVAASIASESKLSMTDSTATTQHGGSASASSSSEAEDDDDMDEHSANKASGAQAVDEVVVVVHATNPDATESLSSSSSSSNAPPVITPLPLLSLLGLPDAAANNSNMAATASAPLSPTWTEPPASPNSTSANPSPLPSPSSCPVDSNAGSAVEPMQVALSEDEEKKDLEQQEKAMVANTASYQKFMRPLQFAEMEKFVHHHYDRSVGGTDQYATAANFKWTPSREWMRRVAGEYADNSRALPLNAESSVFMRVHEQKMEFLKMLITGPEGTPYAGGCFVFDVYLPQNYPGSPPKCNLMTTGKGQVRFNPNLYNCGKVCLSLLGTWSGGAGEGWSASTSTLLQLAVSIQSLILVPEPYFNEPGYEQSMGSAHAQQASDSYNQVIEDATIRWAMLDALKNPHPGFEDVINAHFYLRKEAILKEVTQWSKKPRRNLGALITQLKQEFAKLKPPALPADDS